MLHKIIENKKKEIEKSKKKLPLHILKSNLRTSKRDFKKSISKNGLSLIAEFKKKSPSKTIIKNRLDIQKVINTYNKSADAVSVLTDKKFFFGSLSDMKKASNLTSLPVFRKDFIIDNYQIYESRFYNADAILLIASILSKTEINEFIKTAKKYKMHCLVEIHTEEDLDKALGTNAQIIGINNRNLETLEIDLGTTLRLAGKIPPKKIVVSESGIKDRNYIHRIKNKVDGVLVGSLFMNSENIEEEIHSLMK